MLSDEELAGIREKARRWRNAPCQTTIEMCDEISRLRAEVARLEAGRLRAETVIAARECLSVAWRDSVWGTKRIAELSDAIADLGRCYPPEEV